MPSIVRKILLNFWKLNCFFKFLVVILYKLKMSAPGNVSAPGDVSALDVSTSGGGRGRVKFLSTPESGKK